MKFYTNITLYGRFILYRGIEDGKHFARRVEYRPTFFVPAKSKTEFRTLNGEYVEPIEPGNISDAREFLERYRDVDTFPIYGNNRYDYAFIADEFPDDIFWDAEHINITYLDIEVSSENGFPDPKDAVDEIIAITIKQGKQITSFGLGEYVPAEGVIYYRCKDERELLSRFIDCWSVRHPDVITGWNVKFFDLPYLLRRIVRVLGEEKANLLSPWKKINEREVFIMNRQQLYYDIYGVSTLDYLDLYKKYSFTPQESYRLDHIAFSELGERKLDYSEYESLQNLYKKDYQKFMEYNIRDVELVERLNDKGRLIELALTLAYDNKVNYEDVFTQVRMWDAIIYNHLKKKNIVIPQMKKGEKHSAYEGAYVKDPQIGSHDWVASFDLNSLYPHLIMQYNISMETLIKPEKYSEEMHRTKTSVEALLNEKVNLEFLKEQKITVTPNNQYFRTSKQGLLGEIMNNMYQDRSRYKKMAIQAQKKLQTVKDDPNQVEYLEKEISRYTNLQLAKKVTLNSAYGAIGNQYFRFFDVAMAEAVTTSGQLSIRWIEKKMNEYLNKILKTNKDYVIASDTDSIYLNLSGLVKQMKLDTGDKKRVIRLLDKICEERLQKVIDDSYSKLATYVNAYDQKMQMKRESLADRAIWTAKKRYILNVYNSEGVEYAEPKLKIMGLEAVKSSTPYACREKIKQALKVIMEKDENAMIDFIEEFRIEFRTLPIEEISFPRSVNGVTEYADSANIFKKGTPIHVKGALVYNHLIKANNLEKKYELIKEGEKIKFCYLIHPNPFNNNTIAFINGLPKELGVHSYIDYTTQFDKSFVEPLKIILDCIGWKTEQISTLEMFY
jgi:DNA polymerase elongation subunit (family B)